MLICTTTVKKTLSLILLLMMGWAAQAQAVNPKQAKKKYSADALPRLGLRVHQGEKIADAIEEARGIYYTSGDICMILIDPGTYEEELTIDVPFLKLKNASPTPSIAMKNGGVDIDENAVRITWHCGHGYQYKSMGEQFNYGGSRARRWNASVLVTAPGFEAEGIIFENSFNMYVSSAELRDSLVDMSHAEEMCGQDMSAYWSTKERPRLMPERPREAYSTEVQKRFYRERASAISFTSEAKGCTLRNCRVVGRQDSFYGDHGASVTVEGGALCGAVDYIFGGLTLTVRNAELVAMINSEKGDKCYISAARGANITTVAKCRKHPEKSPVSIAAIDSIPENEYVEKGMLFDRCTVRFATEDEIVDPGNEPIYLGRPWRWWGETVFRKTKAEAGVLAEERWSLGLTKGHIAPWSVEK